LKPLVIKQAPEAAQQLAAVGQAATTAAVLASAVLNTVMSGCLA